MKKQLVLIFALLAIIKVLLSSFIHVPLGFTDSLTYLEVAKSFFDSFNFIELAESQYPFLYPLLISPAFIFNDMTLVHFSIKLINAILSSLIIFPAYLLCSEFLNKKKSLFIAVLISFIPPIFAFTFYFMSENLFYSLLLFTFYFILKAYKENTLKWNLLAGISIGLCYLTRTISLFLFPLIIITILINIKQIKNKLILIFASIATITPLFILRSINSGFKISNLVGYENSVREVSSGLHLLPKITWFFLYIDYIIIALGILFFIFSVYAIFKYKNLDYKEKLLVQIVFISTFFLFIISAYHSGSYEHYNDSRIMGRYIAGLYPLFIILGTVTLEKFEKIPNYIPILTSIYLSIATPIILFDAFFPVNNMSWSHIGILKYLLINTEYSIIITIILVTISLLFIFVKKSKSILKLFLVYFIIISLLNTAIIIYDSEVRWYPAEPVQLGIWFNNNIKEQGEIMFITEGYEDELQELHSDNILSEKQIPERISSYWIRGKTKEDNISNYENYNYIITRKELPLLVIKEFGDVKIYHNVFKWEN